MVIFNLNAIASTHNMLKHKEKSGCKFASFSDLSTDVSTKKKKFFFMNLEV